MIRVEPVSDRASLKEFIRLPWKLYHSDPHWVPPLLVERFHTFSLKNPYFQHARWQCWTAYRGSEPVGRISAQIDDLHLSRYKDQTGFFGLVEAEHDASVFQALFQTAEKWLQAQGMTAVRGPFNLSINQECGLLVDGFDSPPMIMMGHARPYYRQYIERNAYEKAQDLLAYRIGIHFTFPPGVCLFLKKAKTSMRIRPLRRKHLKEDLAIIKDIYEEAWSENWGFLPFTNAEFSEIGQQLKLLVEDDFVQIAEIDGEPTAMLVAFPNIHEVIQDLNGRLFPWGWLKILWRLKASYPQSGRVALMGVRKRFQSSPMGAAMAYGLIEAVREAGLRKNIQQIETSWILEDNKRMRHILESLGAEPYKTYRIYEKKLQ
ncbi:MAG: N-acetyltransferase [Nitrospirota bacterium]|nr:N-acetyltransferase [Nitrospirota bacterium]MDH4362287.1 N-acetyltransferase [Nitrospirota bacterium]MDH5573886.1 N-acetyltransferase [Nitrospirota bacterium]